MAWCWKSDDIVVHAFDCILALLDDVDVDAEAIFDDADEDEDG